MNPSEPVTDGRPRVMAPGETVAFEIAAGSYLRLAQVEGAQVADLVSFARGDTAERLSMFHSRSANASWRLTAGHVLMSTRGRPMWTIVRDTLRENYTGGGYCNPRVNLRRYGEAGEATCEGNLVAGLRRWGIDRHGFDPDTCFNVFMNVAYDPSGTWAIRQTPAGLDDVILMRAECDQVVGLSNCPQLLSAVNDHGLKRLELTVGPARYFETA